MLLGTRGQAWSSSRPARPGHNLLLEVSSSLERGEGLKGGGGALCLGGDRPQRHSKQRWTARSGTGAGGDWPLLRLSDVRQMMPCVMMTCVSCPPRGLSGRGAASRRQQERATEPRQERRVFACPGAVAMRRRAPPARAPSSSRHCRSRARVDTDSAKGDGEGVGEASGAAGLLPRRRPPQA